MRNVRLKTLRARGHEVLVEPLLNVEFLDTGALPLDGVQALIATSRNGLRALARNDSLEQAKSCRCSRWARRRPQWGQALGFDRIIEGEGTAAALVPLIAETCDAGKGALLHLAGERLAADLKGELEKLGFSVSRPHLYRTVAVQSFSAEMKEAMAAGDLDGVLLMSPETARTWTSLLSTSAFFRGGGDIRYFCLSQAVADRLSGLGGVEILVAETPQEDRLLALITRKTAH